MGGERIFVSIASYCDLDCEPTVEDLFAKAGDPSRVSVGICWQYSADLPRTLAVPRGHETRVRLAAFRSSESRGAGWARGVAFGLNDGEEFVLSIDSHMRFERAWDERLIYALQRCPTSKSVLSALLPNHERGAFHLDDANSFFRVAVGGLASPTSAQMVNLCGVSDDVRNFTHPIPSGSVVFNFIFGRREAFEEVRIDPHIYFHGDEVTHSARLWTSGYDIYQPHFRVAYHRWMSNGSYKTRLDPVTDRARQRVRHLLGMEPASDPGALDELERYQLGSARSLPAYFEFLGVDMQRRIIDRKALLGSWGDSAGRSNRRTASAVSLGIRDWKIRARRRMRPIRFVEHPRTDRASDVAGAGRLAHRRTRCSDIVISCVHDFHYRWDPLIARSRGVGGSEIAVIHLARHLRELSGRPVKVFNTRTHCLSLDGVEYIPNTLAPEYFASNEPAVHVAWRHNVKITDAPTYVWAHDIWVDGGERTDLYDRLVVLSPFQKTEMTKVRGLPEEKIFLSRNGIDLERFDFPRDPKKKRGKVVYSSCPSRGMEAAMRVMDKVVTQVPEAELHLFYGFEVMHMHGRGEEVARFERGMRERAYVRYHGNVTQRDLVHHLADAEVWLYPTDFAETFCITALEMLGCGVYPIVRNIGALPDTLANAAKLGMCEIMDSPCETDEQVALYADRVVSAIVESKHERVRYDLAPHSWREVAKEWIDEWGLS